MIDTSVESMTVSKPELENGEPQPFRQATPSGIVLDSVPDITKPTGGLIDLAIKDQQPQKSPARRTAPQPSNTLMNAFVDMMSGLLTTENDNYLTAAESGEIIVRCKLYLNSLLGNPLARRYIATTMLVVRNNYSHLDKKMRDKLIEFLYTYQQVKDRSDTIEDELLKLYGSGVRPL